ncbi:MAG: AAA family ATPase [Actinobacteria bacterium]|nr:AAA family ATPase [Actinomycetota bacterium]
MRGLVERPFRLSVRIGVNRGPVFAGEIGPSYRRTYTIMGDAVNLAARLAYAAGPGELLAADEVLDRSRTAFETTPREPFSVKGKARPIHASVVGPIIAAPRRPDPGDRAPIVGRETEVAALMEALGAARAGSGRVVELVGEPGIGKSRLIEEIGARAEGVPTLATVCEEYEVSTAYFPFRTLLRRAVGAAAEDDEGVLRKLVDVVERLTPGLRPWIPLLASAAGVEAPSTPQTLSLEEQFRRARLHRAVSDLLAGVLAGPAVFVFEDTHWMDEASADLVAHLLAETPSRPWLLIVTRRDTATGYRAPDEPHVIRLEPGPLPPEAAAEMVGSATEDAPLHPHEIEALARRSGGNPLFLRELLAAARAPGGLEALPDSVEATIAARIDRLGPADRGTLRRLSVLGTAFDAGRPSGTRSSSRCTSSTRGATPRRGTTRAWAESARAPSTPTSRPPSCSNAPRRRPGTCRASRRTSWAA